MGQWGVGGLIKPKCLVEIKFSWATPVACTKYGHLFLSKARKLTSAVLVAQVREPPHVGQVHGESYDRHEKIRFVRPLLPARPPTSLHRDRRRRVSSASAAFATAAAAAVSAVIVVHGHRCDLPPDSAAELSTRFPANSTAQQQQREQYYNRHV